MATFRLVHVHPHPDDESIACGGTLARYVDQGWDVHVVTCTAGEEGENLSGIDLGDEDLVVHRRRELAEALRILGVDNHHRLGYRDSGMAGSPANDHPDSFHRADLDEAAGALADILLEVRPHVVVSDDENGTYGHPDHVKANRVTVRAVELAAERGWDVPKRYVHALSRTRMRRLHRRLLEAGLTSPFGDDRAEADLPFGVDDERITTRIDVRDHLGRKQAAMAAHASQIGPDSFFLNIPPEIGVESLGVEEYVLERGPSVDGVESDLGAGLG